MTLRTLLRCKWNGNVFLARTVLSQFNFFTILMVAVFLGLSVLSYPACAAEYNGVAGDLQNDPNWFSGYAHQSFFPGTTANVLSSDNTAVIDYDPSNPGNANPDYVFGGLADSENSAGNGVTVRDGYVNKDLYGGWSKSGSAISNTVDFRDGFVGEYVYGGYSENGTAAGNTVDISGGTVGIAVYGGRSVTKDVTDNEVTVSGGFVTEDARGGWSSSGVVSFNTISISSGSVGNDVHGGWGLSGSVENNTANISGGNVGRMVYGGQSNNGNVTANRVNITAAGFVGRNVYGGYSSGSNGNAEGNIVNISGGWVNDDVYGGYSAGGKAANNVVDMSDGTVGSNLYGGWSGVGDGDVEKNSVILSGGIVNRSVYGGRANNAGSVLSNTADVSNVSIGGSVYGGRANTGNADGNAATATNATLSSIYGGYSAGGSATNNSVEITDSSLTGHIYGGWGYSDATDNTVTIAGNVLLTNSYILGGYTSGTGDAFTGNTLNFKSAGISAVGVGNFQYYNFYLPGGTSANDTMLSVINVVNVAGTTANVFLDDIVNLQAGDRVALISSSSGTSGSTINDRSVALMGAFIAYDFKIYTADDTLWAELESTRLTDDGKIVTESPVASVSFLNQGADLAGLLDYLEVSPDKRLNAFAIAYGNSFSYDVGSGLDTKGFSLLAGLMRGVPVGNNSLILSAFIESGWGSYDSYSIYSGVPAKGSGDTNYYGGGLYMRYLWDNDTSGGLYAEASLRYGRVKTDFQSSGLSLADFSYDSSNTYYGGQAGLGYLWTLSEKTRLEVTGKYIWAHIDSDEITTSAGDRLRFDSIDSKRLRTGFRIYRDCGNVNPFTLYYGAAYEYEFDGDVDGRFVGSYYLDGYSLSGGSGIGELGVMFRPSRDNDRLTIQLGVQGYVGTREGISGTLKLQYAF